MSRIGALGLCLAVVLGGCGETVQTINSGPARKFDTPAWTPYPTPFRVPGWTPGSKASYDAQLSRRAEKQNDYAPR